MACPEISPPCYSIHQQYTPLTPQAFIREVREELIKVQVLQGSDDPEPRQSYLAGFKTKVGAQEGGQLELCARAAFPGGGREQLLPGSFCRIM